MRAVLSRTTRREFKEFFFCIIDLMSGPEGFAMTGEGKKGGEGGRGWWEGGREGERGGGASWMG